jgi:hypothetical protein
MGVLASLLTKAAGWKGTGLSKSKAPSVTDKGVPTNWTFKAAAIVSAFL